MSNQSEFAVPKERQKVTVKLVGGEALEGHIFLEYHPEAQTLFQKIFSFLESDTEFFPLSAEGSGPQFISKKQTKLFSVEYSQDEAVFSIMHIEDITVHFSDGSKATGSLMADIPPERGRLSDCLNLPTKFLSARMGDAIVFINKNAVQKVVYSGKK